MTELANSQNNSSKLVSDIVLKSITATCGP